MINALKNLSVNMCHIKNYCKRYSNSGVYIYVFIHIYMEMNFLRCATMQLEV